MTEIKDRITVRLSVQAGFSITLGVYDGPITREMVAGHVARMIADNGAHEFIETIAIDGVALDEEEQVLCNT